MILFVPNGKSQLSPKASAMTLERKFAKRFRFNGLGEA